MSFVARGPQSVGSASDRPEHGFGRTSAKRFLQLSIGRPTGLLRDANHHKAPGNARTHSSSVAANSNGEQILSRVGTGDDH